MELLSRGFRIECEGCGAYSPVIKDGPALLTAWNRRAEQAAELAKFKALAETLAIDLWECARALQSLHQIPGTGADGRLWQRIKEITDAAHAAVAQYKETRDVAD